MILKEIKHDTKENFRNITKKNWSGQTIKMIKIDQNVWAYTSPVNPYEYSILGFTNVLYAKHVLVKVITWEDEIETHRISRVTTVHWLDKDNKEQWIQFVSLQGFHKRKS